MAKLYFRYGAMNSGKSTHLIQVSYNYFENNKNVILIKPLIDTKGDNKIVSRTGLERKVDYLIDKNEKIKDKICLENLDCILVDEAQFFTEDQITELFVISKVYDIPVICYGIKTDFKSNSFPGSKRLFELSDELEELKTICSCGQSARFNARIVNGDFTLDGNQVAIDGENKVTYKPLCGKCYIEKVLKLKKV